jgi:hypothetical protein
LFHHQICNKVTNLFAFVINRQPYLLFYNHPSAIQLMKQSSLIHLLKKTTAKLIGDFKCRPYNQANLLINPFAFIRGSP